MAERFSVGQVVTIRYGKQQGLHGTVVKNQLADVYRVRLEDGSVLVFSGKGLEKRNRPERRAH